MRSEADQPWPACIYHEGKGVVWGHDLDEFKQMAWQEHNIVPDDEYNPIEVDPPVEVTDAMVRQWIWDNEGTINRENGHFACTDCYIRIGQPSSSRGWVAP